METMTLNQLLSSYGWHLAVVGFLGTLVVGILKKPFNRLIKGKATEVTEYSQTKETAFDVVAFVLGFIIAAGLGCAYTALAQHFGWIYNVVDGNKNFATYDVYVYLSNSLGAWLFQTLYYQIWKKCGVKTIFGIIKNAVVRVFTKNKDGKFDINEVTATVLKAIKNGKLNINEVISMVTNAVPEIAADVVDQVSKQADEAASVNSDDAIAKLEEITRTLLADVPEGKLSSVATQLTDAASKKIKEVSKKPVEVSDSAEVKEITEPKRPTIKF